MTNPVIIIHDLATNEIIEREMTSAELKQLAKDETEALEAKAKAESQAALKAEILERLQITEEQAKALLS